MNWGNENILQGTVTLIGAGPGDPELITLKGLRALRAADVVLHDRLVSRRLLEETRDDALLINVGKQPDKHRITQDEIHQMLVTYARAGNRVVRLKGGDPFIYGRGFEEIDACRKNNIPTSVIPGITSAIAGPGAAGVPVTLRGLARSFAVITAESGSDYDDPSYDWSALAKVDTLIILMGCRTIARSAKALMMAGKSPDTPVACVERATLASQRVVSGTLGTIAAVARKQQLEAPMTAVIGEVAREAKDSSPGKRRGRVKLGRS